MHWTCGFGRRIAKLTEPQVPYLAGAGSGWRDAERRRLKQERGYGLTLYGWDGDTLAMRQRGSDARRRITCMNRAASRPLLRRRGRRCLMRAPPKSLS